MIIVVTKIVHKPNFKLGRDVGGPDALACVWVNEGTEADALAAEQRMGPDGWSVHRLDASTKDPLGTARRAAMTAAKIKISPTWRGGKGGDYQGA